MKILVKFPTRARPLKALQTLKGYIARLSPAMNEVLFLVSIDDDDAETVKHTMDFVACADGVPGCKVEVKTGRSIGKVHAINRDIAGVHEFRWDVLVVISDDMTCNAVNWDAALAQYCANRPEVFCLHFNDGHRGRELCTVPVMSWAAWRQHGNVYHPDYVSLWCDNEWTEVWKPEYMDLVLFRHDHPVYTGGPADALLKSTESWASIDHATYKRRKVRGFPRYSPLLTIGICTLPQRALDLRRLRIVLDPQVAANEGMVEVILNGEVAPSIGMKRQKILDQANGRYVCFIDDDDLIPPDYAKRIRDALEFGGELMDCIGFIGEYTCRGVEAKPFIHSLDNKTNYESPLFYHRSPMHLNPVRIDLARRAGFRDRSYGEDCDYGAKLLPLLKTQIMLEEPPMYYYLYVPEASEAEKRAAREGTEGRGNHEPDGSLRRHKPAPVPLSLGSPRRGKLRM